MKSPKKSSGRKPARGRGGQDAVALLKADHRKVEGLFKRAEKAKGGAKQALVEQICQELIIHTTLEEEIFYPACRSEDVEADKMDEAQVEHDGAKVLINELLDSGLGSSMYDAKVKVLSEYIKHHVKEEEQPRKGVFAEAKRKGVDVMALGSEMKARKKELMQLAESGGLPRPEPKSIHGMRSEDAGENGAGEGGMGGRLSHFVEAAKRATVGRNVRISAKR
jgi:uncharacterized protein (UPF0335 family)